jgi:hypothetical protein
MYINHDTQFQEFKSYKQKCEVIEKQKMDHFAKRKEWEKKNQNKEYPYSFEQEPLKKAPVSLLCEVQDIFNAYV